MGENLHEDGIHITDGSTIENRGLVFVGKNRDKSIDKTIIVDEGVNVSLTIKDLKIEAKEGPAIWIRPGAVLRLTLTLDGENYLKGSNGYAGIACEAFFDKDGTYNKEKSGHLIIDGEGKLTAIGGNSEAIDKNGEKTADITNTNNLSWKVGAGAGIGGNGYCGRLIDEDNNLYDPRSTGGDFGIIEIHSGDLTVYGGSNTSDSNFAGSGAGIGGGGIGYAIGKSYGWVYSGVININGGNIVSYGGGRVSSVLANTHFSGGSGIGSGGDGNNGYTSSYIETYINGGNIKAYGGMFSAGIGGGNNGSSGDVFIEGGEVFAKGYGEGVEGGAGIGGGDNMYNGYIHIGGASKVTAIGYGIASGIGCGFIKGFTKLVDDARIGDILIDGNSDVIAIGGFYTGKNRSGETIFAGGPGIGADIGMDEYSPLIKITINTSKRVVAYSHSRSQSIGYGVYTRSYYKDEVTAQNTLNDVDSDKVMQKNSNDKKRFLFVVGKNVGEIFMISSDNSVPVFWGLNNSLEGLSEENINLEDSSKIKVEWSKNGEKLTFDSIDNISKIISENLVSSGTVADFEVISWGRILGAPTPEIKNDDSTYIDGNTKPSGNISSANIPNDGSEIKNGGIKPLPTREEDGKDIIPDVSNVDVKDTNSHFDKSDDAITVNSSFVLSKNSSLPRTGDSSMYYAYMAFLLSLMYIGYRLKSAFKGLSKITKRHI